MLRSGLTYKRNYKEQPYLGEKNEFSAWFTWISDQSRTEDFATAFAGQLMPNARPAEPVLPPHPTGAQIALYKVLTDAVKTWDIKFEKLGQKAITMRSTVHSSTGDYIHSMIQIAQNAVDALNDPLGESQKCNMEMNIILQNCMPDLTLIAPQLMNRLNQSTDRNGLAAHSATFHAVYAELNHMCRIVNVNIDVHLPPAAIKLAYLSGIHDAMFRLKKAELMADDQKTWIMCAVEFTNTINALTIVDSRGYSSIAATAFNATTDMYRGQHYSNQQQSSLRNQHAFRAYPLKSCNNCHLVGHFIDGCRYETCRNCFHLYHRDDPKGHRTASCTYPRRHSEDGRIAVPYGQDEYRRDDRRDDHRIDIRNDRDRSRDRGHSAERNSRDRSPAREPARDSRDRGRSPARNDRGRGGSKSPVLNGRSTPGPANDDDEAALFAEFKASRKRV